MDTLLRHAARRTGTAGMITKIHAYLFALVFLSLGIDRIRCVPQQPATTGSVSAPVISVVIERTTEPVRQSREDFLSQFGQPGYIDHMELKNKLRRRSVDSIYATYMGWCTMTDVNGRITFPRRHDKNEIILVFTRTLIPVLIDDNLVHHFVSGEPVAYYRLEIAERGHNKEKYWKITQLPTPSDYVVPLYALVIIAKPEQIVIDDRFAPIIRGADLILPTLYAKPTLTPAMNALHFLKVNRYFSPVEFALRFAPQRYAKMVAA